MSITIDAFGDDCVEGCRVGDGEELQRELAAGFFEGFDRMCDIGPILSYIG